MKKFLGCWISLIVGLGLGWSGGCTRSTPPEPPSVQTPAVVADTKTVGTMPPAPVKPDPKVIWEKLAGQARTELEANRLPEAQKQLDELAKVYVEPEKPDEAQQKELAALSKLVLDKRKAMNAQEREAKLTEAQRLLDEGKLVEAASATDFVLARAPTVEQQAKAQALRSAIESLRRSRGLMQSSLRFLGSSDSREVAAARIELAKQPDVAMPLLAEITAQADKPTLVANALSLMVVLDRPAQAIPAMVGVLRRTEQKQNWPDAISAIELLKRPGAGEPLLALALSSATPEGRIAALTALAKVVDPPQRTLVALLPIVHEDGPALAAALTACTRAVELLGQFDLVARRGLDVELSADDEKRLAALPSRLLKLAAAGESEADTARQAKTLAIMTRLMPAAALEGVKIARASAELPENKAAAVLDGVWNSTDPASMWRYPATGRGTIQLDLGSERTVVGVRIWNLNDPAALALGWKDIAIFVSREPTEIRNPTTSIVPTAPGVASAHDYSVLVPIAFQRGRYVEISAKSLWATGEGNSGLTEIQVLGF